MRINDPAMTNIILSAHYLVGRFPNVNSPVLLGPNEIKSLPDKLRAMARDAIQIAEVIEQKGDV